MSEIDLAEAANFGHEALLNELKPLKASDSTFPYWLSSAALDLCVALTNDKLKDKLKNVKKLRTKVKWGFEEIKNFWDFLSEEEKEHMDYCQSRFNRICGEKLTKGKPQELHTKVKASRPTARKCANLEKPTTKLRNEKAP